MSYQASTEEHPLTIIDIAGLAPLVKARMDAGPFDYISGGAEDDWTMRENTRAFNTKQILPRVLQGIEHVDLTTNLWDIELSSPVIEAPTAAQGLAHARAEKAAAEGTAAAGSIFTIGTYGNTLIEDIAAAAPKAPQLFQLYMSKDDGFNRYILDRAVKAGAKAIVLTVDATIGGYREEDLLNHFQFPLPMPNLTAYHGSASGKGEGIAAIYAAAKQAIVPADIEKIKQMSDLPVIVKGIQASADAAVALGAGADGIWVSNHGGRQLDGGPASFAVLPEIAEVVQKRVPLIFDSGVLRGEHVFKALASGADLVAIGRPVLYGLNLGGAAGVESVFKHYQKELAITMQLAGARTIEEIKNTTLREL
ncbi:alpha-hydroxy-acid oxidizing protein [Enterococcus hirae]|nr:alpha-hydroxy-acid oxidizing protein [Enterococcus hirae]